MEYSQAQNSPFDFVGKFFRHLVDHTVPSSRNDFKPHLLHGRSLFLYAALIIAVKVVVLSAPVLLVADQASSMSITTDNVFNLTNQSRASYSLPALKYNSVLEKAAQAKADDMLAKSYFSHTSPDGRLPWDFITASGYNYITAGENLAVDFVCAECVEDAWMNSPGHKANILNKNYEEIGVGISQGQYQGHYSIFVVQMFGTSMEQPLKTLNKSVSPKVVVVPEKNQKQPAVQIISAETSVLDNAFVVKVKTSGQVTKGYVVYGDKAMLLLPKGNDTWQASIPLKNLLNQNIVVKVENAEGKSAQKQLGYVGKTLAESLGSPETGKVASIQVFGQNINLKLFENYFFAGLLALLLVALLIAIAVRRHIQHLPMIANTAFVVIFASLLWLH